MYEFCLAIMEEGSEKVLMGGLRNPRTTKTIMFFVHMKDGRVTFYDIVECIPVSTLEHLISTMKDSIETEGEGVPASILCSESISPKGVFESLAYHLEHSKPRGRMVLSELAKTFERCFR